jgi:ribosomal protein L13E
MVRSLVQSVRMSHDDRQKRAEDVEQRESDDPLVQLERKLRDGKSVDVQEVRKAWRTARYPRAMVQVLAHRRRTDLAVQAASILGIEVDTSSDSWREDLEAELFERFFGMPFAEMDALAEQIRRAIPDPAA